MDPVRPSEVNPNGIASPQLRRCPVARFGAGLQIATQPALRVDLPQLQGLQDREQLPAQGFRTLGKSVNALIINPEWVVS